MFKCVVPKSETANIALFTKVTGIGIQGFGRWRQGSSRTQGRDTRATDRLQFLNFHKDEREWAYGYTELDEGDAGNPWWFMKGVVEEEEEVEGAASLRPPEPVLIAIHHNVRRAEGITSDEGQTCLQYATKITSEMIDYLEKECEDDKICKGSLSIIGRSTKRRGGIQKPVRKIHGEAK